MKLYEIAHCRAGDKGNIATLSVFPYDPQDYHRLRQALTQDRVAEHLREIATGGVTRYEVPNLPALHFVCTRSPEHSVTVTLNLDAHGKSLSSALLQMDLPSDDTAHRDATGPARPPTTTTSEATLASAGGRRTLTNARRRADRLVEQLTQTEKLQLVHGTGRPSRTRPDGTAGTIAGIPRLGIRDLVMGDGPNGVGNGSTGVTAFPAAIALAASWDRRLLTSVGAAIGVEHLRKGHGVALTPTVNIVRIPHWGRSFETLGEDPYLSGELATAQIDGVQSTGVIATVKHLAVNNQEDDRWAVDAIVSERALREIYLPAFEATVEAGVLSVMMAYNRINGSFATQSQHLMREILHQEWGFAGFTVSDWGATHDAAESARAGLDVEMPHGPLPHYPAHYGDELNDAVETGQVAADRLDDMAARVLTAMAAVGHLDAEAHTPAAAATSAKHRSLARDAAAAGTVLLRNECGALPLGPDVHRLAVIGVAADTAPKITGGGSALVRPDVVVTPLAALQARAGVDVVFAPGTAGTAMLPAIPPALLRSVDGYNGWNVAMIAPDGTPGPVQAGWEAFIDNDLPAGHGMGGVWSARWETTFTPTATGDHRFSLDASGHAVLTVGDATIVNDGRDLSTIQHATIALTAGEPTRLTLSYRAELLEKRSPRVGVGMLPPDPGLLAAAVEAARTSDAAIVVVNDLRTEGGDVPTLRLPGDQDMLISAVAAANQRTIVVLHSAGPVLMPWLDDVEAVLAAWYPGQESGHALADILFGEVNPSGRLPVTFPAADDQHPAADDPRHYPGVEGKVYYDEELLVGYRWWQASNERPLFPFGHGLSYTRFDYEGVDLSPDGADLLVSWTVRNTGPHRGREIAQLYLGYPDIAGEPPLQLRGFKDVLLNPG